MIEFFSIPDFAFEDIAVPDWVYPDLEDEREDSIPAESPPPSHEDLVAHSHPLGKACPLEHSALHVAKNVHSPTKLPLSWGRMEASRSYDFASVPQQPLLPAEETADRWRAIGQSIESLVEEL